MINNISTQKSNYNAKVYSHGKINLPANVRNDLGLHDGDNVIFIKKARSYVITTRNTLIKEAQDYCKSLKNNDFTVDDFIAERRAEALKEIEI